MKEILFISTLFLLIIINSNHVFALFGLNKNCTIKEFKGKNFVNHDSAKKLNIDDSVKDKFKKFDELAGKCKVIVLQDSSFIKKEFSSEVKLFI
jgi:hypothetical protein